MDDANTLGGGGGNPIERLEKKTKKRYREKWDETEKVKEY